MPNTTPLSIVCIDEITHNLVAFCDKPTLAVLARTSSIFTEHALDALWYDLDSLWSLLRLFPEGVITKGEDIPHFSVNRLILPRDWARVKSYAKRVRKWALGDSILIDELFVDHISFGRGVQYILPNLQHMEVLARSISAVHLQTLFICPTLESVVIYNTDPTTKTSSSMSTFFLTLADVASGSLKSLDVHWAARAPVPLDQFTAGLTDLFEHPLEQLTTVALRTPGCIDANGFQALACLPALTNLQLNLRQVKNIHDYTTPLLHKTPFPSLRDLYLVGEPGTFIRVLSFLAFSPRMVSLRFGVHHYPQSRDLERLFEIVATYPSLATLQFNVLELDEQDVAAANRLYWDTPELYHHNLSTLSGLLSLKHLVGLHLEFGVPVHLTDVDLESLARAWPNIKTLNLCTSPTCGRPAPALGRTPIPAAPSFAGLFTLTKRCPQLEHVGLCLENMQRAINVEYLIPSMPIVSSKLSMLNVGWTKAGPKPASVAAILCAAYPNLESFQWDTSRGGSGVLGDPSEGWQQVAEMCPLLRAVRENERMRIADEAQASENMSMAVD